MVNKQLKEVFIILFLIFTYSYLGYLRIIINIGFLEYLLCVTNRVRYFRGRVPNFNRSEARKQRFLSSSSDWLKLGTLENTVLYLYISNQKNQTLPLK